MHRDMYLRKRSAPGVLAASAGWSPDNDRARGMLEDDDVFVFDKCFCHPCFHALVEDIESWHASCLLVVELEETLESGLDFGPGFDDLSGILTSIHRCKPQHVLALHFGLRVRPQEPGVVFRLVVLVDKGSGEVGFFADRRVLRGHDPIAALSLRYADGALHVLHGGPIHLILGHAFPLLGQACALFLAASQCALWSP